MSPVTKSIDAKGLPCPKPVILTRKALAEGGFELLEITVDNEAARENILKFAAYAHCPVEGVITEGSLHRIRLAPDEGTNAAAAPETEACPSPRQAAGATVLLSSEGLGQGDPDLARLLMRGFVYALGECEPPPRRILLMNGGVRLAVEGSDSLEHLRSLAKLGAEILACGTCLEFFKLKEALAVGRITNMYEIASLLLQGPTVAL